MAKTFKVVGLHFVLSQQSAFGILYAVQRPVF